MIIEIRHYSIKPGRREEFIECFEKVFRKALLDAEMPVFGPMRDLQDPNKVHWMRAFPSVEDRDGIKKSFYEGPVWNDEVQSLVMPLIEHFEHELTETTEGFQAFS